MYRLVCANCDHTFYDVRVPCDEDPDTPCCPACKNSHVQSTLIELPEGEKWAESIQCKKEKGSCKKTCGLRIAKTE